MGRVGLSQRRILSKGRRISARGPDGRGSGDSCCQKRLAIPSEEGCSCGVLLIAKGQQQIEGTAASLGGWKAEAGGCPQ